MADISKINESIDTHFKSNQGQNWIASQGKTEDEICLTYDKQTPRGEYVALHIYRNFPEIKNIVIHYPCYGDVKISKEDLIKNGYRL